MAGKKITGLDPLGATPASGDWLVIVDVSDTSESAEGTTKKVSVSDAIPSGGLPYKELVFTYTSTDSSDNGTAVILQNDFVGTPVITRGVSDGGVTVELTGAFTSAKVWSSAQVTGDDNSTSLFVNSLLRNDVDSVKFYISNSSGAAFSGTLGDAANPTNVFCSFSIRVYP